MEASSVRLQRLLETSTNSTNSNGKVSSSIESMPYATAATIAAEYTKRIQHLEKELRDAHLQISEGNVAKHSSATTSIELEKARERIGNLEQAVVLLTREKDEVTRHHRDAEEAYAKLFEKASDIDGAKDTAIRNAKRDIEKNLRVEYTQKMDEYERRVEREMNEFREQQVKQVHEAILDAHFSVPEREKMKEDHEDELARLKARVDETVEFHVREGVNQVKSERKSRGERGVVGDLREVEEGERYRGTVETRRQRGRD
jgi:chromosome segregation ATPase